MKKFLKNCNEFKAENENFCEMSLEMNGNLDKPPDPLLNQQGNTCIDKSNLSHVEDPTSISNINTVLNICHNL